MQLRVVRKYSKSNKHVNRGEFIGFFFYYNTLNDFTNDCNYNRTLFLLFFSKTKLSSIEQIPSIYDSQANRSNCLKNYFRILQFYIFQCVITITSTNTLYNYFLYRYLHYYLLIFYYFIEYYNFQKLFYSWMQCRL